MAESSSSLAASDITDPRIRLAATVAKMRSSQSGARVWPRVRLAVLVIVLIPLAVFGYFRMQYTNAVGTIRKSLTNYDDYTALQHIKELESRDGITAESSFLRARAYRHLGEDMLFMQHIELASQLGFPQKVLSSEQLLRDAQLGFLGTEVFDKLTPLLEGTEVEFEEVSAAIVYGLLDGNRIDQVFPVLKLWQTQDPKSVWIPYFYGMLAQYQRDWKRSLTAFEEAKKLNPDFVPLYRQLGFSYQTLQEHEKAIEYFELYRTKIPSDMDVTSNLITSLISVDRKQDALQLIEPLVESNKATIAMRQNLAAIHLDNDEPQKAIDVLGNIATLWPEDVSTANLLSRAHQRLGNEEPAAKFSAIAESGQKDLQTVDGRIGQLQNPELDTAENNYLIGHILLHKKSREEGVQWLKIAVNRDPKFVRAYEDLVIFFSRTNQAELAAQYQSIVNGLRGTQP